MKLFTLIILITCSFLGLQAQHKAIALGGGNYQFESAKFAPNAGLIYEYKDLEISSLIGFGLSSSAIFRDDLSINGGPTLFVHPDENIVIGLAPGVGYDNFASPKYINSRLKSNEIYFNFKLMAGYNLQINDMVSIFPVANWDIYKNQSALSIKVGVGFNF